MNKKANISLTFIVISTIVFIGAFIILFQMYANMMILNNGNIDSAYMASYNKIAGYNETLTTNADNFRITSIKDFAVAVGNLVINVLNIGLTSIRNLANGAFLAIDIFNVLQTAIPGLYWLFWILITSATVYISYRFIQSARSSLQEA